MDKFKISVITPSYNQANYIRQTIESVLIQKSSKYDIEHIVIDGGSTDTTIEILKEYPYIRWISEPDKGQADAVNKGFSLATGDIIGWINSDDFYNRGAFNTVYHFFNSFPDVDMIYGRCYLVDQKGEFIKEWNPTEFRLKYLIYRGASFIPQQTVFFRRIVLQQMDYMCDTAISDAMDYDLWLRIGQRFKVQKIDKPLACFRLHPAAKTALRPKLQRVESLKARDKYNPYGPLTTRVGLLCYFAKRICEKTYQLRFRV